MLLILFFFKIYEINCLISFKISKSPTAPIYPFRLGVRTEYLIDGFRLICSITSLASANCGTHFGETNEVTYYFE